MIPLEYLSKCRGTRLSESRLCFVDPMNFRNDVWLSISLQENVHKGLHGTSKKVFLVLWNDLLKREAEETDSGMEHQMRTSLQSSLAVLWQEHLSLRLQAPKSTSKNCQSLFLSNGEPWNSNVIPRVLFSKRCCEVAQTKSRNSPLHPLHPGTWTLHKTKGQWRRVSSIYLLESDWWSPSTERLQNLPW